MGKALRIVTELTSQEFRWLIRRESVERAEDGSLVGHIVAFLPSCPPAR